MLLVLAGCGVERTYLLRRAGEDLACDPKQIAYEHIWDTSYEVMGCGQRALYECPARAACELRSKAVDR